MEKTIFLICLLIMEGRSLTEDEMEAKFTALKEEFFQELEIKLGESAKIKSISKQVKANQDLNTAQQSVIENHNIEINDLKEMVENHDQKHTDSNLSIIDLKENATGFENEHTEFRDLIKNQSDTNTAQHEAIENNFGEFDDVKENLEDLGEELVKNQSVIQMKIQAQIANLHPPISHHGSLILVATGSNKNYVQVIDPNSTASCSSLPSYPLSTTGSVGGILNNAPLICGGYSSSFHSECYIHDKNSNSWRLHANLKTKRYDSPIAPMNGGLWLTGGHNGQRLSSTELVYPNGTVLYGQNLPAPRYGHCAVTLHNGLIMIIGGWPDHKSVITFDPVNNLFNTGPSTNYDRKHTACTLFYSPMHNNRPVILTAGGHGQTTSEIYDYTIASSWVKFSSLPSTHTTSYWGASALPSISGKGAYLQHGKYFYELRCSVTLCNWSKMQQELGESVKNAVMIYLPTGSGYSC